MTQDERWMANYNEVMRFLEENHRNPSKHRIEEHDMLNWVKQQRKLMKGERSLHVGRDDRPFVISSGVEKSLARPCPRKLMRSLHALRLVEMTRKGARDDRGGKRDDHPLSFRASSRNLK
jgi:hypothetical protein